MDGWKREGCNRCMDECQSPQSPIPNPQSRFPIPSSRSSSSTHPLIQSSLSRTPSQQEKNQQDRNRYAQQPQQDPAGFAVLAFQNLHCPFLVQISATVTDGQRGQFQSTCQLCAAD